MTREELLKDIVNESQARKVKGANGFYLLDLTTANMLLQVRSALKTDSGRVKFDSLDWEVLVPFSWSLIK